MSRKLYSLCGADRARPFSPHVWKTKLSLAHKGLDFDIVPIGFTEIPKVEEGATKLVPLAARRRPAGTGQFRDRRLSRRELSGSAVAVWRARAAMAMARFIEGWSQTTLHPAIARIIIKDIHDRLDPVDRVYFRESREARFGTSLEAVAETGGAALATFSDKLEPLRHMLKFQPYLGGERPLFADYIVFGALQWARIVSPQRLLSPRRSGHRLVRALPRPARRHRPLCDSGVKPARLAANRE